MLYNKVNGLFKFCKVCTQQRYLWTTPINLLNQKWREERALPLNPNAHGVLTDSPDYSFLDGRITPYGVGQKKRLLKEKETAKQIIALTKEVDFAVERHTKLKLEEEERIRRIFDRKLKPKGIQLLKTK